MLMVIISKGRLRYMRFISTSSGSSMTQGPHQVAQMLTRRSFLASSLLATSFLMPSRSMVFRVTGSASHVARDFFTSSFLVAHLLEQRKPLVFSTGTGF